MSGTHGTWLGAFWGCQTGDAPSTTGFFCDSCGANYFRPMAECKMRRRKYSFCRVCHTLIGDAIGAIAP